MSSGFDKLKSIGAQKIHEATHIARAHIKSILEENFEDMNSVQLNGFISILEREYSVDLGDLKQKARDYFKNSSSSVKKVKATNVFLAHKKKKRLTSIYIALGVALFVLFFIFTATSSKEEPPKVDNSAIESVKSALPMVEIEQNITTADENNTSIKEEIEVPSEEVVPETPAAAAESLSFKITPNTKVWLGYIDVAEQKKYQTTFSDELSLDPSKEWLLAFGHGHIMIEVNEVVTKFITPNNIRFSYKNSELKEISVEEFKSLNSGKLW